MEITYKKVDGTYYVGKAIKLSIDESMINKRVSITIDFPDYDQPIHVRGFGKTLESAIENACVKYDEVNV